MSLASLAIPSKRACCASMRASTSSRAAACGSCHGQDSACRPPARGPARGRRPPPPRWPRRAPAGLVAHVLRHRGGPDHRGGVGERAHAPDAPPPRRRRGRSRKATAQAARWPTCASSRSTTRTGRRHHQQDDARRRRPRRPDGGPGPGVPRYSSGRCRSSSVAVRLGEREQLGRVLGPRLRSPPARRASAPARAPARARRRRPRWTRSPARHRPW